MVQHRLKSRADLQGLKMRIPGLAGEVFDAAGGSAVRIAGGEVYTSMQTGVIDAVEWVGPYNDRTLGLMEVGDYYYYPGWHEPGAMLETIVNEEALAALPEDLQAIVRIAARATNTDMLDDFTANNSESLQILLREFDTEVLPLPEDVLDALYESSQQAIQALVESDPMAAKIAASYFEFAEKVRTYHEISERGYLNARIVYCPGNSLLRDRPSEFIFVYRDINEFAFRDFQGLAILLRVNPDLHKNAHRTSTGFQNITVTTHYCANMNGRQKRHTLNSNCCHTAFGQL